METRNHECYVSIEVAKLLKEVGFDWPCNHAICCDSTHYPNLKEGDVLEYNYLECSELMEGKKPHMLLCPTLDVTQRWLREVKGIEVYAHVFYDSREMLDEWDVYVYEVNHITKHIEDYISSYDIYNTYEEAQEAGIKKVLEIILEKDE
jgi:hypothetical protein